MAQQVTKSVVAPTGQTVDLGALMLEDSQSVDGMNVQQILQQTQTNFCLLYKELFKIKTMLKMSISICSTSIDLALTN